MGFRAPLKGFGVDLRQLQSWSLGPYSMAASINGGPLYRGPYDKSPTI